MQSTIVSKKNRETAFALLLVSIWVSSLTACSSNSPKPPSEKPISENRELKMDDSDKTLTEALKERADSSAKKIPEEKKKVMASAIDVLRESKVEDKVLKTGQKVPEFELTDASGKNVVLKEELANGPAVLVFYRGGWCPYCNMNLHYLQKKLDDIKAQGATLIAISPETPDNTVSTKEKNELEFAVLSDSGNKVAEKFGLMFKVPDDLIEVYKEFGIDLEKSNGDKTHTLPLSATFIVDKDGTIIERFVDVDYKKRMDPEEIISILKKKNESK